MLDESPLKRCRMVNDAPHEFERRQRRRPQGSHPPSTPITTVSGSWDEDEDEEAGARGETMIRYRYGGC
jgi:hypothetical protein